MVRIRVVRVRQAKTQKQLAEISGLSQSYINELETGKKCNPSMAVLDKLASALQVNVVELLEDDSAVL